MLAYTYISPGKFELIDKPKPELQSPRDAIVRITLGSICTRDLHIKHGSVPHAVPSITAGHEMVGVVEKVGAEGSRFGACHCLELCLLFGTYERWRGVGMLGRIDATEWHKRSQSLRRQWLEFIK